MGSCCHRIDKPINMTIATVTNDMKPNPNPNSNPYTTVNQKPNDNPRSNFLSLVGDNNYHRRSNCRRSKMSDHQINGMQMEFQTNINFAVPALSADHLPSELSHLYLSGSVIHVKHG